MRKGIKKMVRLQHVRHLLDVKRHCSKTIVTMAKAQKHGKTLIRMGLLIFNRLIISFSFTKIGAILHRRPPKVAIKPSNYAYKAYKCLMARR